jgi:transcription elongation factor Elf1
MTLHSPISDEELELSAELRISDECFFCGVPLEKPITCMVRMTHSGKHPTCGECAASFGLTKKRIFELKLNVEKEYVK